MKTMMLGAVAALMLATAAQAQAPITHGPKTAVDGVLAAEKYYSDRLGEVGVAKGMSEFMDVKDGLAFTGGEPVRGGPAVFEAYGGAAAASYTLSWVPAEVFASDGGDMAASWGHFRIVAKDPKIKPVTGRYVTVWRKNAEGHWKAIMDIGNPDG